MALVIGLATVIMGAGWALSILIEAAIASQERRT